MMKLGPKTTLAGSRSASKAVSFIANEGGLSQLVSVGTSSNMSTAIDADYVVVSPTVDCFYRMGSSPAATNDGTDTFLFGGIPVRIRIVSGMKLAFRTSTGSGVVYITPDTED